MEKFLHLLWEFLCSLDADSDPRRLCRTAANRCITGHPVLGWKA